MYESNDNRESSKDSLSWTENITRRSWLRLSVAAISLVGIYPLLLRCATGKAPAPDVIPAEHPDQFSKQVRNYYSDRTDKLMDDFDQSAHLVREYMVKYYEETIVDFWIKQSRLKYKQLIPELPYVGGDKNSLTRILLSTSVFIPIVKILRDEGLSTRQIGQMIVATATEAYQKKIPWFVKRIIRWDYFSDSGKQKKKASALLSQKKRYPEDWVFQYKEGDGAIYDYEIVYSECALKKFWSSQGLKEYVPYLCLCDYAIWQAVGAEVKRTKTLGNGSSECDFKYIKKGSDVPSPWPPESHPEWTGLYEN